MSTDAWAPAPGYLNASTLGLPPRRTADALRAAVDDWQAGRACAVAYGDVVEAARGLYARLVGVPTAWVAVGSQASVMVAEVAAALPDGATVVVVEGDFTSVTGPFEAQSRRGVRLVPVPLEELAAVVRATRPAAVAFSLAQSVDGRLVDAAAVADAARAVGALTLCDTTQATGWLDLDAGDWDVTVCSAYKWLCCPRGSAFMTVRPEALDRLAGHNRGWYSGADVWTSVYGLGFAPAPDARRFDVSPAWLAWVGAVTSLETLLAVPAAHRRRHGAALADQLRSRLGLPAQARPVLCLEDRHGSVLTALTSAGCTAAARGGRVRLAFHLWNDVDDVDRVVDALSGSGTRSLVRA
ncbi:aminotransferase class V-fold PLP-dependent enzyme [Aquipuribacter sp. MA13-6]|uniref:aminotransferase class V-fold PLP-dependent enzyme n=1 Tax=unclassified Aquipuribacter TaxID=2635084 RepID=UPI003EEF1CAD